MIRVERGGRVIEFGFKTPHAYRHIRSGRERACYLKPPVTLRNRREFFQDYGISRRSECRKNIINISREVIGRILQDYGCADCTEIMPEDDKIIGQIGRASC